jgi:aspartyl aminopeptidase
LDTAELAAADAFCAGYMSFLNQAKTEREAVAYMKEKAIALGFEAFVPGKNYAPGHKIYAENRGKALILAVVGKESVETGLRITAAHVDSPRLDLKPVPLYEDSDLALLKTHYYGGIKKYQWVALPLALHGVVVRKDGGTVEICIGEKPEDPKFCITDLLPHLGKEQAQRTLDVGIKGEELNIVFGARPLVLDEKSEGVKLAILKLLHEQYGIVEDDLCAAELEAVPALPACDIGLDRALVGGYGQDDRVCAYPIFKALPLEEIPTHTAVVVLADKEEIGSCGNTGLESHFFLDFLTDLALGNGKNPRVTAQKSKCLSADVNAGFDPTWPGVMDAGNAAYLGGGVVLTKYTGARGKAGASDAHAEFVAFVRNVLDQAHVQWQMGELGKVDEGGGGTVAADLANLGLDVVDIGVPILSMHAPFELAAKTDIYALFKGVEAFYRS